MRAIFRLTGPIIKPQCEEEASFCSRRWRLIQEVLTICFVCYLRVFFDCLIVLIYTVLQKVLKVHFRRPFSKFIFSTGNTMELVTCLSLLKRPKTVSFCKYKILLPWIPYSAKELLFSSAVFWITQTLYCLQYYLLSKAHNLLLSVLSLWISSRPKISVQTEDNSLKEVHTLN